MGEALRTIRRCAAALAVAGAISVISVAGASAEISRRLADRLERISTDVRLPVLIILDEQLAPDTHAGRRSIRLRALRATADRTQPELLGVVKERRVRRFWLVNALAAEATPEEIRSLNGRKGVAQVDLDPVVHSTAAIKGAAFPDPGGLRWGHEALRVVPVWQVKKITGAGVRVGSIDTGVDASHAALGGRVVAFRDFVSGRATPYDDNGHGTHTIGTMAGGGVLGGAPIGVAPDALIVVAKAMDANGDGRGSAILAAAQWMADPDENPATNDFPAVINNAWASPSGQDPWFRPMMRQLTALNILPVFAAGNTGPGPGTISGPPTYPEALTVAAVAQNATAAEFSSRGPVVWSDPETTGLPAAGTPLTKPDVSAPGVAIVSSVPGGYLAYSGTSMASAYVAGVAALMKQAAPGLGPVEAADILRATAFGLGAPGADPVFGMGLVDAASAVARSLNEPLPPRPSPLGRLKVAASTETQGVMVVRGRLAYAARVRVTMRSGAQMTTGIRRAGPFRLQLRLGTSHPGRYRVSLTAFSSDRRRIGATVGRSFQVRRLVARSAI